MIAIRKGVNPEPARDTERTTIVHTESKGGGGGVLIAVILLIAVLALLFFLFGGNLTGGDGDDVNVSVRGP